MKQIKAITLWWMTMDPHTIKRFKTTPGSVNDTQRMMTI